MSRTKADNELIGACERFLKGWPHFCKCVDFNHSNLDADAIRFFNEAPAGIALTLQMKKGEPIDDKV